uniref:Uncharacterized protein n=1 Tax=Lepeophtheirus salmonis TaxID=72036 RepID=A0A0K2TXZ0_LEPSM
MTSHFCLESLAILSLPPFHSLFPPPIYYFSHLYSNHSANIDFFHIFPPNSSQISFIYDDEHRG